MPPHSNYAEDLFPLGHGHPLWIPESLNGCEVNIGAVGWLEDGGFRTLFNATVPTDDELNVNMFVPPDHVPLTIDSRARRRDQILTEPFMFSKSVRNIGVAAETSATE